jgi:hypothetical protein
MSFQLSWLHIHRSLLIVFVLPVGRVSAVCSLLLHNRRILLRSNCSGLAPRDVLGDAEQDDEAEGMEDAVDVRQPHVCLPTPLVIVEVSSSKDDGYDHPDGHRDV